MLLRKTGEENPLSICKKAGRLHWKSILPLTLIALSLLVLPGADMLSTGFRDILSLDSTSRLSSLMMVSLTPTIMGTQLMSSSSYVFLVLR